jgi:hypothetical protein
MILVALNVKELPMLIIQETLKTTANVLRDITMMVVMIVKYVTVTALNVIPLMENALVAKEPQLATEPEYNRINANVLPVILILDLMTVKLAIVNVQVVAALQ